MTLRCLIVDDSPRFLAAARSLLQRQGITVLDTASTSTEALRLTAELHPDVILVDIDLGTESGFELTRRLHRQPGQPGHPPTPVILISTHAEQDYADLLTDSPAIGFLPKTILSAAAIHDLLNGHPDHHSPDTPLHPLNEPPGT